VKPATRRQLRREAWEASGAPQAQERLRAALAAAGVEVPDLRAVVDGGGTPTAKLHATIAFMGDELDQLVAALERAATSEEITLNVLLNLSEQSTDGRLRDAIARVRSAVRDQLEAGESQ
jgi:hypothetical protein